MAQKQIVLGLNGKLVEALEQEGGGWLSQHGVEITTLYLPPAAKVWCNSNFDYLHQTNWSGL